MQMLANAFVQKCKILSDMVLRCCVKEKQVYVRHCYHLTLFYTKGGYFCRSLGFLAINSFRKRVLF